MRIPLITIFTLFPLAAYAQDVFDDPMTTVIGLVILAVIGIGVPFAISYIVRILSSDVLVTYIGSYAILVLGYLLTNMLFPGLPGSRAVDIAINLIPLSMLGTFLARWAYYLTLVRRGKD